MMTPDIIKWYLLANIIYYVQKFYTWHHIDDAKSIIASNEPL